MVDNSWFEGTNSPGAGDLGQIQALQQNLAATADAAAHARTSLNGLKDQVSDAVWRGKPAEEFKDNISSDFLGQLDKLHSSYADAAAGFQTYIHAVSDIKSRANALASKIYEAQTHYNTQAAALHQWLVANPDSGSYSHGDLTASGWHEGSPYTVTYHAAAAPAGTKPGSAAADAAASKAANASSNHSTLQGNVDDAYNALQALYRQMDTLKTHDRVQADNAVVAKVDHAGSEGMRNESGWHKFFHALSTIAKWVGIAVLVVAVVAVCVALPGIGEVGLLGVLAEATSIGGAEIAGLSLSSAAIYGGVGASALALTGDLGQTFTGGGPGFLKIGLDVIGLVPGVGKAGEFLSRLGGPAEDFVTGAETFINSTKGAVTTRLDKLVETIESSALHGKIPKLTGPVVKGATATSGVVLKYGTNAPTDSTFGAVVWGGKKLNSIWSNAGWVFPQMSEKTAESAAKAAYNSQFHGINASQAQQQIRQFQQSNPSGAAQAHQIAQNLAKGSGASLSYPKQHTYPQAVPVQ